MQTVRTNWLAIAACVVIGMGLGFVFYGFLFNQQWMAGNGLTFDEATKVLSKNGVAQESSSNPMIFNAVAMLLYAVIMNWLLQLANATNWMAGAKIGAAVGVIAFLGVATSNLFNFTPMSLTMVDGLYSWLLFILMGAVLGGWQKK